MVHDQPSEVASKLRKATGAMPPPPLSRVEAKHSGNTATITVADFLFDTHERGLAGRQPAAQWKT